MLVERPQATPVQNIREEPIPAGSPECPVPVALLKANWQSFN
jgi:hypothetical protein